MSRWCNPSPPYPSSQSRLITSNKKSDIKIYVPNVFCGDKKFQVALIHRCYRSENSLDRLQDRRLYGFMCENVEIRNDRQCFRHHSYVTNEAAYEKMSLFILFLFFLVVPLRDCLFAFFVFPPLLADVALLRLRP